VPYLYIALQFLQKTAVLCENPNIVKKIEALQQDHGSTQQSQDEQE
jgi:hypothetical protein